ncbi:MAG: 3-deoxy-D-manno-octulosonic acid transferase [Burkholderiaceae bacterium]|nr:3-deoxy-D-manno-octulosonic acid transferase [Burkholderiaceae bacterium]
MAHYPFGLYFLYEAIWHLLIPFVILRLLWRSRHHRGYRQHIAERFGFYGAKKLQTQPIWIHAVSVGETHATQALIEKLLHEGHPVLLTHMTPTGREAGSALYWKAIQQGRLQQVYLPYDLCWAIERFLKRFRPQLGLLMETEAWPGFVFRAHQLGIPLFLINARLSERSFKRVQSFGQAGQILFQSFTGILAQSGHDAKRYQALGVKNVHIVGNMKFDIASQPETLALGMHWKNAIQVQGRLAVCAASTRAGEEAIILEAWKHILTTNNWTSPPLLMMVPRHPDRFSEVADLIYQSGLTFERRSGMSDPRSSEEVDPSLHWAKIDVLLGDSMGEMAAYYAASDFVVMGGSLLPTGGQNLIEACANGCPVILGPHTYNFQKASEDAIACGAAIRVTGDLNSELINALAKAIEELLVNNAERKKRTDYALAFAAEHQGATQRILDQLKPALQN